ncbi:MAG: hypothetical protein FJ091_18300 [Deltaproteobacteria bacterium]|nr:hypothetical protein [Deltaproteobacteria bacterium]
MTGRRTAGALALTALLATHAHAESPFATLSRGRAANAPLPVTRDFAAPSLEVARRLAISALQDLGFALEAANSEAGTISASRLDAHPLRLTVTVGARDEATISAAVVTDHAGTPVADPRPAEAFFSAYAAALSPPPEID